MHFKHISTSSEVFRGISQKPLSVTAAGIGEIEAADFIAKMSGEHSIPAMLKLVDSLSRKSELHDVYPSN